MTVTEAEDYLLEHVLSLLFLKALPLLDILQQVPTPGILHDHEEMLGALKDLKEPYDVRMSYLLQDEDLLEDFLLRKVVLHVVFVYGFDGYVLASQLVDAESHLTESTLANEFDELIEIEGCCGYLLVLFDVGLIVLDELLALLHDLGVDIEGAWSKARALLSRHLIWVLHHFVRPLGAVGPWLRLLELQLHFRAVVALLLCASDPSLRDALRVNHIVA